MENYYCTKNSSSKSPMNRMDRPGPGILSPPGPFLTPSPSPSVSASPRLQPSPSLSPYPQDVLLVSNTITNTTQEQERKAATPGRRQSIHQVNNSPNAGAVVFHPSPAQSPAAAATIVSNTSAGHEFNTTLVGSNNISLNKKGKQRQSNTTYIGYGQSTGAIVAGNPSGTFTTVGSTVLDSSTKGQTTKKATVIPSPQPQSQNHIHLPNQANTKIIQNNQVQNQPAISPLLRTDSPIAISASPSPNLRSPPPQNQMIQQIPLTAAGINQPQVLQFFSGPQIIHAAQQAALVQAQQQFQIQSQQPQQIQPHQAQQHQQHHHHQQQTHQNATQPKGAQKAKQILPKPQKGTNKTQANGAPNNISPPSPQPPPPQQQQQQQPSQQPILLPASNLNPQPLLLNQVPMLVQQNTPQGLQLILRPQTPQLTATSQLVIHNGRPQHHQQQQQQLLRIVGTNGAMQLAPTFIVSSQANLIQQNLQNLKVTAAGTHSGPMTTTQLTGLHPTIATATNAPRSTQQFATINGTILGPTTAGSGQILQNLQLNGNLAQIQMPNGLNGSIISTAQIPTQAHFQQGIIQQPQIQLIASPAVTPQPTIIPSVTPEPVLRNTPTPSGSTTLVIEQKTTNTNNPPTTPVKNNNNSMPNTVPVPSATPPENKSAKKKPRKKKNSPVLMNGNEGMVLFSSPPPPAVAPQENVEASPPVAKQKLDLGNVMKLCGIDDEDFMDFDDEITPLPPQPMISTQPSQPQQQQQSKPMEQQIVQDNIPVSISVNETQPQMNIVAPQTNNGTTPNFVIKFDQNDTQPFSISVPNIPTSIVPSPVVVATSTASNNTNNVVTTPSQCNSKFPTIQSQMHEIQNQLLGVSTVAASVTTTTTTTVVPSNIKQPPKKKPIRKNGKKEVVISQQPQVVINAQGSDNKPKILAQPAPQMAIPTSIALPLQSPVLAAKPAPIPTIQPHPQQQQQQQQPQPTPATTLLSQLTGHLSLALTEGGERILLRHDPNLPQDAQSQTILQAVLNGFLPSLTIIHEPLIDKTPKPLPTIVSKPQAIIKPPPEIKKATPPPAPPVLGPNQKLLNLPKIEPHQQLFCLNMETSKITQISPGETTTALGPMERIVIAPAGINVQQLASCMAAQNQNQQMKPTVVNQQPPAQQLVIPNSQQPAQQQQQQTIHQPQSGTTIYSQIQPQVTKQVANVAPIIDQSKAKLEPKTTTKKGKPRKNAKILPSTIVTTTSATSSTVISTTTSTATTKKLDLSVKPNTNPVQIVQPNIAKQITATVAPSINSTTTKLVGVTAPIQQNRQLSQPQITPQRVGSTTIQQINQNQVVPQPVPSQTRIQTIELTQQKQTMLRTVQMQIQQLSTKLQNKNLLSKINVPTDIDPNSPIYNKPLQPIDMSNLPNMKDPEIYTHLQRLFIEQQKILASGKVIPTPDGFVPGPNGQIVSAPAQVLKQQQEMLEAKTKKANLTNIVQPNNHNATIQQQIQPSQPTIVPLPPQPQQKIQIYPMQQHHQQQPQPQPHQPTLPQTILQPIQQQQPQTVSVIPQGVQQIQINSTTITPKARPPQTVIPSNAKLPASTQLIIKPQTSGKPTFNGPPLNLQPSIAIKAIKSEPPQKQQQQQQQIQIKEEVDHSIISNQPIKEVQIKNEIESSKPKIARQSLFAQQLNSDLQGCSEPDFKSPFCNKEEAVKRLLKYHCMYQKDEDLNSEDEADFENTAYGFQDKFNSIAQRYQQLLIDESMRIFPTSEQCLLSRLVVETDKENLDMLKISSHEEEIKEEPAPSFDNVFDRLKSECEISKKEDSFDFFQTNGYLKKDTTTPSSSTNCWNGDTSNCYIPDNIDALDTSTNKDVDDVNNRYDDWFLGPNTNNQTTTNGDSSNKYSDIFNSSTNSKDVEHQFNDLFNSNTNSNSGDISSNHLSEFFQSTTTTTTSVKHVNEVDSIFCESKHITQKTTTTKFDDLFSDSAGSPVTNTVHNNNNHFVQQNHHSNMMEENNSNFGNFLDYIGDKDSNCSRKRQWNGESIDTDKKMCFRNSVDSPTNGDIFSTLIQQNSTNHRQTPDVTSHFHPTNFENTGNMLTNHNHHHHQMANLSGSSGLSNTSTNCDDDINRHVQNAIDSILNLQNSESDSLNFTLDQSMGSFLGENTSDSTVVTSDNHGHNHHNIHHHHQTNNHHNYNDIVGGCLIGGGPVGDQDDDSSIIPSSGTSVVNSGVGGVGVGVGGVESGVGVDFSCVAGIDDTVKSIMTS